MVVSNDDFLDIYVVQCSWFYDGVGCGFVDCCVGFG